MEAWVGIGRTISLDNASRLIEAAAEMGAASACHFLVLHAIASRPPVKAALRLALLGLDGARP